MLARGGILKSAQCRPFFGGLLFLASLFLVLFFAGVILFSILGRLQLDSSIPGKRPERSCRKIALWLTLFAAPLAYAVWSLLAHDLRSGVNGYSNYIVAVDQRGLPDVGYLGVL